MAHLGPGRDVDRFVTSAPGDSRGKGKILILGATYLHNDLKVLPPPPPQLKPCIRSLFSLSSFLVIYSLQQRRRRTVYAVFSLSIIYTRRFSFVCEVHKKINAPTEKETLIISPNLAPRNFIVFRPTPFSLQFCLQLGWNRSLIFQAKYVT
jgi:hypothetical protein